MMIKLILCLFGVISLSSNNEIRLPVIVKFITTAYESELSFSSHAKAIFIRDTTKKNESCITTLPSCEKALIKHSPQFQETACALPGRYRSFRCSFNMLWVKKFIFNIYRIKIKPNIHINILRNSSATIHKTYLSYWFIIKCYINNFYTSYQHICSKLLFGTISSNFISPLSFAESLSSLSNSPDQGDKAEKTKGYLSEGYYKQPPSPLSHTPLSIQILLGAIVIPASLYLFCYALFKRGIRFKAALGYSLLGGSSFILTVAVLLTMIRG